MKNKLNILTIATVILIVVITVQGVFSFGFSVPYTRDNPLKMVPGETKILPLSLQSGEGDKKYLLTVDSGKEIATIADSNNLYDVPGKGEKIANIKISIPADAKAGQEYFISYLLQDRTNTENSGTVALGQQMTVTMKVVVQTNENAPVQPVPETPQSNGGLTWLLLTIILAAAIVVVVYLIYKSVKKK